MDGLFAILVSALASPRKARVVLKYLRGPRVAQRHVYLADITTLLQTLVAELSEGSALNLEPKDGAISIDVIRLDRALDVEVVLLNQAPSRGNFVEALKELGFSRIEVQSRASKSSGFMSRVPVKLS